MPLFPVPFPSPFAFALASWSRSRGARRGFDFAGDDGAGSSAPGQLRGEGRGPRGAGGGMRTRPDGRARRRRAAGAFHDSGRHGRRADTAAAAAQGAPRAAGGGQIQLVAGTGRRRKGTQGGAAPGRVRIETTWMGRGTARPAKGGEGARGGGRRDEASPRAPRPPAPVHACCRLGCLRLRPLARRAPRRPRHLSLGERTSTEIERAPPVRTPVTLTLTLTRHASSPPAPTPAPPLRLRWRAVAPLVRLPRKRPAARATETRRRGGQTSAHTRTPARPHAHSSPSNLVTLPISILVPARASPRRRAGRRYHGASHTGGPRTRARERPLRTPMGRVDPLRQRWERHALAIDGARSGMGMGAFAEARRGMGMGTS